MTRDYSDYITDILNSIDEIDEFIGDIEYEIFSTDKKTINAVIRSLEVIGEAATKIPRDIRERWPEIPWKRMAGMRNKLIHEYFGVDLEIVWEVCTDEIPPLKPSIERLLKEMANDDFSKLSRPRYPMPDFVKDALMETGLLNAYKSRPPYQQNDYIGWITRAKREETRQKRLAQMLYELERGDLYMNMKYKQRSSGK